VQQVLDDSAHRGEIVDNEDLHVAVHPHLLITAAALVARFMSTSPPCVP